jgi:hypothetical protein
MAAKIPSLLTFHAVWAWWSPLEALSSKTFLRCLEGTEGM